ncbi:MAG: YqjK-like family protein, partial [Candidatus Accumulibacter sp.]|nr:YqjK-like family protein [Accumulibacter sp.]
MSRRFDELLLRRGRLIERIAGQRAALRRDSEPVARALGKVDFAIAGVRSGIGYLRRHVLTASAVAGVFLIFRGKASLRWAGRAFSLWQSWRALRNALLNL